MTAVLIIAIIGVVLALLNRTRNEETVSPAAKVAKAAEEATTQSDDLWSAFEAALKGEGSPDPRVPSVKPQGEPDGTDLRSGTPAFDTTVGGMDEGTVGFVNETAVLHDEYGNMWLLSNAAVHGMPSRDRVGVSRQPEGWLLEQRATTSRLVDGEDVVRVVGRFDIR